MSLKLLINVLQYTGHLINESLTYSPMAPGRRRTYHFISFSQVALQKMPRLNVMMIYNNTHGIKHKMVKDILVRMNLLFNIIF